MARIAGINIADHKHAEVALTGIFLHGTRGMLGVLLGLMFVKEIDDAPHHVAAGIIIGRLGNGNDLDPILAQLALIETKVDSIPKETGQTVYDDRLEQGGLLLPIGNHLLEGIA